jgi:hypothetical protein
MQHVRAAFIGWLLGVLLATAGGCAVPLPVKRLYVATWQSCFPPSASNTVFQPVR